MTEKQLEYKTRTAGGETYTKITKPNGKEIYKGPGGGFVSKQEFERADRSTVLDAVETSAGNKYMKMRDRDGNIRYKGPDGKFVSSQSFSAASGHEEVQVVNSEGEVQTKKRKYVQPSDEPTGIGVSGTIETPDGPIAVAREVMSRYGHFVADEDIDPDKIVPFSKENLGREYTVGELREAFKNAHKQKPSVGPVRYLVD